ncbi:TolC family protein [Balneolaceae bacterium ANBcel3]|nr:TolC family protein [Balneolaceae bacterium ANBcel3]
MNQVLFRLKDSTTWEKLLQTGSVSRQKHRFNLIVRIFIILTVGTFYIQGSIYAYNFSSQDTLKLTLDEAVRIALENNFGIQNVHLDEERASQQVREAWGSVYPQVNASGNYMRNLVTANPFAGSGAGDLFADFGAIGWLRYNEEARLAGEELLTYEEYFERQIQGYEDSGITPPSMDDDPFSVDNQFTASLSITQTLFNGAAFAAIQGAEQFQRLSEDAVHREHQMVIDQVRQAYFGALLAWQQVEVLQSSVERLTVTLEEARKTARQGLISRSDVLSAEVELVNLETSLIEAENQAELAKKGLSLLLNLEVNQPVELIGDLTMAALQPVSQDVKAHAVDLALEHRPDLHMAEGMIQLNRINERIGRSSYRPIVSAFANLDYIGRVPDNRTVIGPDPSDPDNPFRFTSETRSFFHSSYWNPNVSVGLSVSWNLFSGFQNRARLQQNRIETRRSQIQHDYLVRAIHLEVDEALRNLDNAERRIMSQRRNIEQAQLNYDFARTRLQEGVGSNLEERQASMLLDQSQLSYLAAIHDYLAAISQFELVIGTSVDYIQP